MWSKRSESSADDLAQRGAGISSEEACDLYQPVSLSPLFLHTSTDCSHSFQLCHIGIGAQVFSKSVIHGIESQHSFSAVAERCLELNKPMRSLPSYEGLKRSKIS